jgi:hypothetical protein
MTGPLVTSALVGSGVGLAHYAAHMLAGDEEDFEDAGVSAAEITVILAATTATYIVLVAGGLA